MPQGSAHETLANLILNLSKDYSSPKFTPHVTLLGNLCGSEEELETKASRLATTLAPYTMRLTKVEYLDEYFRSLFFRVEASSQVIQANLKAKDLFNRQNDPEYFPHLSIMYGDFSANTKEAIIERIGQELALSFQIQGLHLVDTSSSPAKWFIVREFQFGRA